MNFLSPHKIKKKDGFSLVELLVVIGMIALLAVIAVPRFDLMRAEVIFRENLQKFIDLSEEARANALANRQCEDSSGVAHLSEKWTVVFREGDSNVDLYCQWDNSGTLTGENQEDLSLSDFVFPSTVITISDITDEFLTSANPTTAYTDYGTNYFSLSFVTGSGQAKIEDLGTSIPTTLTGNYLGEMRIVMTYQYDNNIQQTFCLNAHSGFPRVNRGGDTCPTL